MQTPESSPERKKSPITTLTSKSWRNLRSKLPVLSPKEDCRGQFVVLSSSLNANRNQATLKSGEQDSQGSQGLPPPLLVTDEDKRVGEVGANNDESRPSHPTLQVLAESPIPRDAPLGHGGSLKLGEPFDEGAIMSDSDRGSTFSFNRQVSCKYYKDVSDIEHTREYARSPSIDSCASFDSFGSLGSYVSNGSYVSLDLYGAAVDSEDPWGEDLSHLDEPDYISALISEANEVPSDDELESLSIGDEMAAVNVRRAKSAPSSCGPSIHRQLSTALRTNGSVSASFKDQRPKRAQSSFTTPSSVWPILE